MHTENNSSNTSSTNQHSTDMLSAEENNNYSRSSSASTAESSMSDDGRDAVTSDDHKKNMDDSTEVNSLPKITRGDATGLYFRKLLHERGVKTALVAHRSPQDFRFGKPLGEGSFSMVYLATEKDSGQKYAIKVLLKDRIRREKKELYVLRERDVMAALTYAYGGHPFILKLYCTFQNSENLFFALSYARHGDLLEWLRRLGSFDETVSLFYASEILAALEFLHNCKIVHRDLKPENILVGEDWHILVSDFGTAKVIDLDEETEDSNEDAVGEDKALKPPPKRKARSSFVGTAHYISPEVLNSESVGTECDYWALGAIIFQMISGQPPFRAINEYQIMKKILNLNYSFPDGFPSTAKDLIEKLLVTKANRLGSRQNGGIEAIKRHSYFRDVEWDKLATGKPPELKPYLPASKGEPAFYGDHTVNDELADENLESNFIDPTSSCMLDLSLAKLEELRDVNNVASNSSPRHIELNICGGTGAQEEERRRKWRDERLAVQRKQNIFHQFVEDNLIFKHGLIDKKKGLFARRRMFLLTEGPRFFYVDPVIMELKGEIPLSTDVRTEAKNFRTFFVYTPKRTYYLFDPDRHAKDWCDAIDVVIKRYFHK